MHFFQNLSSASGEGGFAPDPQGSIREHRWGTFVPRPLICPPLKKILRVPMHEQLKIACYMTLLPAYLKLRFLLRLFYTCNFSDV